MVRECTVCKKLDVLDEETSFHRFPKNAEHRNLWISLLGLEGDRLPNQHAVICSNHFQPSDFHRGTDGRKKLKPESLPRILHRAFDSESSEIQSDSTTSGTPPTTKIKTLKENVFEQLIEETPAFVIREENKLEEETSTSLLSIAGPSGLCTTVISKDFTLPLAPHSPHSSSSTLTASEVELLKQDERSSRKRKRYTYPGDLESSDFSTPRKKRRNLDMMQTKIKLQQKKIKLLQTSVKRLSSKVTTLKELLSCLRNKNFISEHAEPALKASLSGVPKELFERILQGPTKQKYNETLRSFALTLSFYSPKAYNYVRETFNASLPDTSTISKWFKVIDGSPGFTQEALNAIKLKSKNGTQSLLCNLVFDEMSIRKLVEWTGKKFTGYVDIGSKISSDCLDEAREVLVFLVTCVNGSWKVPVGYFFLDGLCATEKAGLVRRCLEMLHDDGKTGVTICSLTFDGAPVNLSTAEVLGAKFEDINNLKTDFPHPVTKEPVYIILDISHMIKLVRNAFGSVTGIKDGNEKPIKWDFINRLEEKQSSEGLHAATKLRKRHIHWVKEKMKVKLATQTLSRSVSDAITFLREDIKDPDFEDSEATSEFILKFNDLFDMLNSRNYWAKYLYKRPFSEKTEQVFMEKFLEIEDYIRGLTLNGRPILSSARKTGFLGILITSLSVKNIYFLYVKEKQVLQYLLTYKLSQDHLELIFSVFRSKGGFNNNPSARQFEAAYKRIIVHSQLKASKNANAVDLDNLTILTCGSGTRLLTTENYNYLEEDDEEEQKYKIYLQTVNEKVDNCLRLDSTFGSSLTTYQDDIVTYIAGYVVRSIEKKITCHKCTSLLKNNVTVSKLQVQKTYGKLVNASEIVILLCKNAEKYFRCFHKTVNLFNKSLKNLLEILINNTLDYQLLAKVYEYCGDHIFDHDVLDNHGAELAKLILNRYFSLRIHHETNRKKDLLYKNRTRSVNTKTVLFRNE